MQKSYRFLLSVLLLGAFLLSACSGTLPGQDDSPQGSAESSQSTEAVFTGTVESMSGTQWLISGQQINVDGSTLVDSNVQVGTIVKVEASVSADGSVLALKIESSQPDDANDNSGNDNDSNTNDNANSNDDNGNDNSNANSNDAMDDDQEVFGVVEAVTLDSITVDGVAYSIADFTEFKDVIAVGDQVKIEFILNADGTFTIREIEKSTGDDDSNSNDDDSNSNDDNGNGDDDNSNGNSNDDDDDHDDNSNDDDGGDDDNGNDNSSDD